MPDGRYFEKWTNGHSSTTVCPIGAKFGKVIYIGLLNQTGSYNFELLKIQRVSQTVAILKK